MNNIINNLCKNDINAHIELTDFLYENILKNTNNMQEFINKINKNFNFNLTLDELREELRSDNRFIIINNDNLKLDISIYKIKVEIGIWHKFFDKNNTYYNYINIFEREDYEFLKLYESFKDFIDKPLFKVFKNYFDNERKKIDYFLEVLKTVKEDRWKYEYDESKLTYPKYKTKTLIYDNIKIDYVSDLFWRDNQEEAEIIITAWVGNIRLYKTDDETSELAIEIIDFIERAEKRIKKEEK